MVIGSRFFATDLSISSGFCVGALVSLSRGPNADLPFTIALLSPISVSGFFADAGPVFVPFCRRALKASSAEAGGLLDVVESRFPVTLGIVV